MSASNYKYYVLSPPSSVFYKVMPKIDEICDLKPVLKHSHVFVSNFRISSLYQACFCFDLTLARPVTS